MSFCLPIQCCLRGLFIFSYLHVSKDKSKLSSNSCGIDSIKEVCEKKGMYFFLCLLTIVNVFLAYFLLDMHTR